MLSMFTTTWRRTKLLLQRRKHLLQGWLLQVNLKKIRIRALELVSLLIFLQCTDKSFFSSSSLYVLTLLNLFCNENPCSSLNWSTMSINPSQLKMSNIRLTRKFTVQFINGKTAMPLKYNFYYSFELNVLYVEILEFHE